MKRIYPFSLAVTAAVCLSVSCITDERPAGPSGGPAEVEIQVTTTGGGGNTRADELAPTPLKEGPDPGIANERKIETLDVLLFKGGEYLYRCEAAPLPESLGSGIYRLSLKESNGPFDVHILANCRYLFDDPTKGPSLSDTALAGKTWAEVHALLVDENPARLVGQAEFVALPMYGYLPNQPLSTTSAPNRWPVAGTLQEGEAYDKAMLRRAVASFDVYLLQDPDTERFELEEMFVYNAADKGALGQIILNQTDHSALDYWYPYDAQRYVVPAGMTTTLRSQEVAQPDPPADPVRGVMHAKKATDPEEYELSVMEGTKMKTYEYIAYQMYVYDNPYISTGNGVAKRPTRVIIAGTYTKEFAKDGNPAVTKKAYYAIDVVESGADTPEEQQGNYRPVIRNYKYEFKVVGVTGPGYDNIEQAGEGPAVHLNVGVYAWDKEDVAVGVRGRYYATMNEKTVELWRNPNNSKDLLLTFNVHDGFDAEAPFELNFVDEGQENGVQKVAKDERGNELNGIENDYYRIVMARTDGQAGTDLEGTGSVVFTVTALQENKMERDRKHDTQKVTVTFRDLVFDIDITQILKAKEDWIDGGDQDWTAE
jgi:hypothetical protein